MEQNSQKGLNFPLLLSAVIITLVLAGAGFYVFSQGRNNTTNNTSTSDKSAAETVNTSLSPTSTFTNTDENSAPGKYIEYSSNLLSENNDKKVIYFFKASWCPTCQALDRNLNNSLGKIPSNTVIIKVDYDSASGATSEELALKPKYGVTYQHTLVQVDSNGNQIKKWNNSYTLDEILSKVN